MTDGRARVGSTRSLGNRVQIPRTWAALWVLCPLTTGSMLAGGCAAVDRRADHPVASARSGQTQAQRPFFDARTQTAQYAGPGREAPAPQNLEEVKIGWFGPDDASHPTAGQMWLAASLAVEDANRVGGYEGLPFRLVPSWSQDPWGTGIGGVTRLVYDEGVWAIVGAPDGPSAHLVEQVVAKARLTFVSPVSTDKTANLANVPWVFSCAPGDHVQAPILARALLSQAGKGGFAVVSCTDHDSRLFSTELLAACKQLEAFPILHLEFRPATAQFGGQLDTIRQAQPAAVALIAGPKESARFLTAMRRDGLTMPVFGGPAMGRRVFIETTGPLAEGVLFPLLWHPSAAGQGSADFARRFEERFGVQPDYTAACTHDATTLLIQAVRQGGLNRVRIRDALRQLSPWTGVTGTITWDPTGQNQRPASLGTVQNGQTTVVEPTDRAAGHQGPVLRRHRRG